MFSLNRIRMIRELREDQIMLGAILIIATGFAYAFLSMPPTATLTNTSHTIIVAKDSYMNLMMFIPMGDNLTGVPLFDAVYRITTSNGEQVNVSRTLYESLDVGNPIIVKYWSKGWLDWKTCEPALI